MIAFQRKYDNQLEKSLKVSEFSVVSAEISDGTTSRHLEQEFDKRQECATCSPTDAAKGWQCRWKRRAKEARNRI